MITLLALALMLVSPLIGFFLAKKEETRSRLDAVRFREYLDGVEPKDRLGEAIKLYENSGYEVVQKDDHLLVSRKNFRFSRFFYGYFFFGIGALVYIVWFLLFATADTKEVPKEQK